MDFIDELRLMNLKGLKEVAKGKIYNANKLNKKDLLEMLIKYYEAEMKREQQFIERELAHRLTRDTTLRRQEDPDIESLEYPFEFIKNGEYSKDDILIPMPGEPDEELGDFPNNIEEYIWVHGGENDVSPWLALLKLNNGNYAFFKGECDYTGFDCQGAMEVYVSKNPSTLINMGMTISDYEIYIKDFRELDHRLTRDTTLRRQENPDIKTLDYPFEYIEKGNYDGYEILRDMPGEPDEELGDFPNNIEEYIWVHFEEGKTLTWLALLKLNNGNYAFFKAETYDFTGFYYCGVMKAYVSKNPSTLISKAMNISDYEIYIKDFS